MSDNTTALHSLLVSPSVAESVTTLQDYDDCNDARKRFAKLSRQHPSFISAEKITAECLQLSSCLVLSSNLSAFYCCFFLKKFLRACIPPSVTSPISNGLNLILPSAKILALAYLLSDTGTRLGSRRKISSVLCSYLLHPISFLLPMSILTGQLVLWHTSPPL